MFHLRRFRAFLFVTVVLVIAIYELYASSPNLDNLSHLSGFGHEAQHPAQPDPRPVAPASDPLAAPPAPPQAEHEPPPAPGAAPGPDFDDAPAVGGTDRSRPQDGGQNAAVASRAPTPAKTAVDGPRTVTGEEFLRKQKPNFELSQQGQGRLNVEPRPADRPRARWQAQEEHFPVEKMTPMPAGEVKQLPRIQYTFGKESEVQKKDRLLKQNAVREAFKHAWNGYTTYALPHDELKPLTNGSADPFNGWGATLVDSLDTLWIMGLKDEFDSAVRHVGNIDFKTSPRKDIPLFETTIRYLGGLLGAYDISGSTYTVLLDKAVELADVIIGAFDTPNRMPIPFYQWAPSYASQPHRSSSHIVMAELGSLAIEFTRLSQITKEQRYYDAVARVTDVLQEWQGKTSYPGLWPIKLDSSGCQKPNFDSDHTILNAEGARGNAGGLQKRQTDDAPTEDPNATPKPNSVIGEEPADFLPPEEEDEDFFNADCETQGLAHEPNALSHVYSIAAMTDSTYEYFPKMHALLGGRSNQYRSMYLNSADVIRKDFIFRPMIEDEKRDIRFLAKREIATMEQDPTKREEIIYEGSHLGCFVGGMFALGSKVFDIPSDMSLAAKLTDGCVWAYESTILGIMPEEFTLTPCANEKDCPWDKERWHDFLDPDLQERFDAVAKYNAQQKALAEASRIATIPKEEQRLSPSDKHKRQIEVTSAENGQPSRELPTEDEHHDEARPVISSLNRPDRHDLDTSHDNRNPEQTFFTPKVTLSHSKYVRARISEERLPPSYTGIKSRAYKLRPEAIESVFIMYRLTGDTAWRDKGWKMFEAVERATRTASGHAMVKDVTSILGEMGDTMESFWLAETLKYFFLLFAEENVVSLDEWVLNTEAHPMRLPKAGTTG